MGATAKRARVVGGSGRSKIESTGAILHYGAENLTRTPVARYCTTFKYMGLMTNITKVR